MGPFSFAIIGLASLSGYVTATGTMQCCASTDCGGGACNFQIDPPNSGNGACISLGGIDSVKPTNIDPGCSCTSFAKVLNY